MSKKIWLILLVVFMCVNMAAVCEAGAASDYKNTITTARETLWKAITNGQGGCATVAVMDNGKIVYSEGIGVADRAKNKPVDKNTRFNIASTSKMFLAVAMLMLVDEGRVSLDEKIVRYVPEFTMKDERYRDITVRMIFNHSTGLPGATNYATYGPDRTMQRLLLETMKDANLKHNPGAMSIYCDDGFTLGEIVVEKVTDQKYIDFLAERIFTPLGMKNTGLSVGEGYYDNIAEYYDLKT
ncbi:MAG TPA: serine hydrolase domain-containing protein, partial [Candidatus Wallbacteria bacterium]|nr:serine hydrolase domain-containing protein [Candidatus Wallbacteria bacterium]